MTLTLTPEQQKTLVEICRAASEFYRNEEDSFRQLADEAEEGDDERMQADMDTRAIGMAGKADKARDMATWIAKGA